MEKYGIHLFVLSHVFYIPALKQVCTRELARQLTVENVVDMLQFARLCDAPSLNVKCMNMISKHIKDVEKTEAWKFLQDHDPWLELDILQFIDEVESVREKKKILLSSYFFAHTWQVGQEQVVESPAWSFLAVHFSLGKFPKFPLTYSIILKNNTI